MVVVIYIFCATVKHLNCNKRSQRNSDDWNAVEKTARKELNGDSSARKWVSSTREWLYDLTRQIRFLEWPMCQSPILFTVSQYIRCSFGMTLCNSEIRKWLQNHFQNSCTDENFLKKFTKGNLYHKCILTNYVRCK